MIETTQRPTSARWVSVNYSSSKTSLTSPEGVGF
nr:MAG TPA: 50S ribosomal protein L31 [Bacteriophage sp.]